MIDLDKHALSIVGYAAAATDCESPDWKAVEGYTKLELRALLTEATWIICPRCRAGRKLWPGGAHRAIVDDGPAASFTWVPCPAAPLWEVLRGKP